MSSLPYAVAIWVKYITFSFSLVLSLVAREDALTQATKYKVTWKTFAMPLVGILAFFIYIYLFNVDIFNIIDQAKNLNLMLYGLAVASVLLETLFFALSWRSLLTSLKVKLSVVKSYLFVWYGIFVDTLIPAESISGEISRIYLVTREENGSEGKVVASLVAHRLMGMGTNIASLFIGLLLLFSTGQLYTTFLENNQVLILMLFLIGISSVFLVLLILLSVKENWTLKVIDGVIRFVDFISRGRWRLQTLRQDAVNSAFMFHDSMKQYRRTPKTIAVSLFFNIVSWIFALAVSYLVFLSFGHQVQWSMIIITTSIVSAVKSIPVGVPFEVGLPEITMSTLYAIFLQSSMGWSYAQAIGVAATATVLIRLLTLWLRFFIGFATQQVVEFSAMKNRKPTAKATETVPGKT